MTDKHSNHRIVSLRSRRGPQTTSERLGNHNLSAAGRGQVVAFRQPRRDSRVVGMDAAGSAASDPAEQIWDALVDNRVVVHYQPQVALATGETEAMEALVRVRAGNALQYPDSFIATAENCGLIVGLGRAVISQACHDLARWRDLGSDLRRIAVNLSAGQLSLDTQLAAFVEERLQANGLCHGDLELELTERQLLVAGSSAMQSLEMLSESGCRIALDDFGSGFSCLAYLTTMPVHSVKLDRQMVSLVPDDKTVCRIVEHVVSLAHDLNIDVVAEGLELERQRDFLLGLGCRLAQGFAYGAPMPREQFERSLKRR